MTPQQRLKYHDAVPGPERTLDSRRDVRLLNEHDTRDRNDGVAVGVVCSIGHQREVWGAEQLFA